MLIRFLFAVIALGVCSTDVFAQDVFVTFGTGMDVGNNSLVVSESTASGTGFVFVRRGFEFDGVQVGLTSNNTSVANITGGNLVNSNIAFGGTRFNNADVDLNSNGVLDNGETGDINSIPAIVDASGITFQAVSVNQNGIIPSAFATFDDGFDVDADAFLFGTFDFDIVGVGSATFALQTTDDDAFAGTTGFLTIPEGERLSPVFGDATLIVDNDPDLPYEDYYPIPIPYEYYYPPYEDYYPEVPQEYVPEPSSVLLLAMGLAGFAARRRR